jgi:hypothetical protein
MAATISAPEVMSSCLDACQRAHHACLEQSVRLLETVPGARGSALLTALTTCIGITRITAEIILIEAMGHREACELCATACRACADLCNTTAGMEDCEKACLNCAQCCDAAREKLAA